MPAYGFQSQFVPAILAGSKAHTMRVERRDKRKPLEGETVIGYCGLRSQRCTWLFSSSVKKAQRIEIDLSMAIPSIRLDGAEQSCGAVGQLIRADGFEDVAAFNKHFEKWAYFVGWLIHWAAEDAQGCAREHACRRCGERLRWSVEAKAFYCSCDGETFHHLKRP